MIAHSVTQIANGTRFRCMFGQIKRGEVFYTIQENLAALAGRSGEGAVNRQGLAKAGNSPIL